MFCTNCGKEIADGSRFCSGCGTPLSNDQQETIPDKNEEPAKTESATISIFGNFNQSIKPDVTANLTDTQTSDDLNNSETARDTAKSPSAPTRVVTKKSILLPLLIGGAAILFVALIVLIVTGVLVFGSPKFRYERQLSLGNKYLDEMDYERAIASYEAAIEIDPKNPEAYKALAELYIAMNDTESAAAVLQTGINETGDDVLNTLLASTVNTAGTDASSGTDSGTGEENQQPASIEFMVTAANGNGAIANAEIEINSGDEKAGTGTTDGSGKFTIQLDPAVQYTVICRAEGYYTRAFDIQGKDSCVIAMVQEIDTEDAYVLLDWNGSQNLDFCVFDAAIKEYTNISHPMDSNGNFLFADNGSDNGFEMICIRDYNAERVRSFYVADRDATDSGKSSSMEADGVSVYVFTHDGLVWSGKADSSKSEPLWYPMYIYAGDVYADDIYISDLSDQAWTSFDPAEQTPGLAEIWKSGYADIVKTYETENPAYSEYDNNLYALIYLNDDSIPELVTDHCGYHCEVYSLVNGKCEEIYSFGYGAGGRAGSTYLERTGYISDSDNDYAGSRTYVSQFFFDGSTVYETTPSMYVDHFVDRNNNGYPDSDEIDFDDPHYFVDKTEVSEEVYASYLTDEEGEWHSINGETPFDEILDKLAF